MFIENKNFINYDGNILCIFRNKTNILWSCIKWITPTTIIVTSAFGEIIKVELKPDKKEPIVSLLSDSHKDVIFCMACSS